MCYCVGGMVMSMQWVDKTVWGGLGAWGRFMVVDKGKEIATAGACGCLFVFHQRAGCGTGEMCLPQRRHVLQHAEQHGLLSFLLLH